MEVLGGAGLAVGRLLDLPSVFEDPQVVHNQMLVEMSHQVAGTIRVTGSPVRVDGRPALAMVSPPALGQDSRRVLLEAGLNQGQVDRLVLDGSVILGGPE